MRLLVKSSIPKSIILLLTLIKSLVNRYLKIAAAAAKSIKLLVPPPPLATKGSAAVPLPVIVEPSTDICTIGLAGSVLSVFNPVTEATVVVGGGVTPPVPPLEMFLT